MLPPSQDVIESFLKAVSCQLSNTPQPVETERTFLLCVAERRPEIKTTHTGL